MVFNRQGRRRKECIRRCEWLGIDFIFSKAVHLSRYLSGRFDVLCIDLAEHFDVFENIRQLRRVFRHFLIGEREASELRDMPDLFGGELRHVRWILQKNPPGRKG